MPSIRQAALDECRKGRDFVLAVILSVHGSSPRHGGTRFLVRADGSIVGTIGGGLFEARVREFALSALAAAASHRAVFSFTGPDAHATEMICGGEAEVLVEFVASGDPASRELFERLAEIDRQRGSAYLLTSIDIPAGGSRPGTLEHLLTDGAGIRVGGFDGADDALAAAPEKRLLKPSQFVGVPGLRHPVFLEWIRPVGTAFIFGAGHVGLCVAHLASYVGFSTILIDDRADFASRERAPEADEVMVIDSFENAVPNLGVDEDGFVVIVTRGHAHDKTVLAQALRSKAGYIGMIGSRRKINLIYQALLMEGFTRADLDRVHAPIGLLIGGETPEEIGLSIVAEMVQVRNRKERP